MAIRTFLNARLQTHHLTDDTKHMFLPLSLTNLLLASPFQVPSVDRVPDLYEYGLCVLFAIFDIT